MRLLVVKVVYTGVLVVAGGRNIYVVYAAGLLRAMPLFIKWFEVDIVGFDVLSICELV